MKIEPTEGDGNSKFQSKNINVIPFFLLLVTVVEVDGAGNGSSISMSSAKDYRFTP